MPDRCQDVYSFIIRIFILHPWDGTVPRVVLGDSRDLTEVPTGGVVADSVGVVTSLTLFFLLHLSFLPLLFGVHCSCSFT